MQIFVDADACPVKEEVYRVARRHALAVTLVANSSMRVPEDEAIRLEVVGGGIDVADDWIAEHVAAGDVVITADVPLAARCVAKRAFVVGTTGYEFTEDNVGDALATRDLLSELRSAGEVTRGPRPMGPRDRSRFLQTLDAVVRKGLRE